MTTQTEHFAEQKRHKKRGEIINEDLITAHKWVIEATGFFKEPQMSEVHEAIEMVYRLGMDTGIKIGGGEL